jgi:outer membrane protein OmpA-like peptidoglycan-associated protein
MIKTPRSLLLASTVLTGAVIAVPGLSASAAPTQPELLAQAGPANSPADAKHRGEKKPPAHPVAPKPPAPHPPQAKAPQPPHPPVARTPQPPHQPAPAATLHNGKPPGAHVEEHKPQPPKMQPAQANPAQQHPPTHTGPEVRGKPGTNERSQSNAPGNPAGTPHGPPRPAQVTPPTTQHNAVGRPPGSPPPSSPVVRGAPPPKGNPATANPQGNAVAQPAGASPPSSVVVRRAPPPKGNPAAVPPPTQAISKSQFMAPKGQAPTAGISAVRAERHEVREGNRVIIQEPDRTIVQEGNRTFIRHNEDDRFAVGARNVQIERHGDQRMTVVWRPDGVQIIDFDDDEGHLIRRVRRDPDGREIVLIDNGFAGARPEPEFLDLPPPVIHIPRDRYIVDADNADESVIYGVLLAPPVEQLTQRYTLDQVRYNEPLRALMPRLDLEINFDTGSWQLTPDQVDRLSFIANGLNRAIQHNPREVFLVEGYTDAVGSDIDNLSLSDRRAESVAVALTEQFGVPPENLVTQGYGKQFLKVQTDAPERANRRVAIQRITPLVDPQAVGMQ